MDINLNQIREKLMQKSKTNPAILNELKLKNAEDISKISDGQLESMLSPKVMGFISFEKEDII